MLLPVIDEIAVHLIADQIDVVLIHDLRDASSTGFIHDCASGVARVVEHNALGFLRDRSLNCFRGRAESVFLLRGNFDHLTAEHGNLAEVIRPTGRDNDYLIARIQNRSQSNADTVGTAVADADVLLRVGREIIFMVSGNSIAESRDPLVCCVMSLVVLPLSAGFVNNGLGRIKVRLAKSKAHNIVQFL